MCMKQIGVPCNMISHIHLWMNVMHMSVHTPILVYAKQAQLVSKESYSSQWSEYLILYMYIPLFPPFMWVLSIVVAIKN
jgi:hypothetical protein